MKGNDPDAALAALAGSKGSVLQKSTPTPTDAARRRVFLGIRQQLKGAGND